jgi:hypothetical protein
MKRTARARITLVVCLVLLVLGGAALAYWKVSGGGSATATTGTTVNLTLSPGTPTAQLYPGGSAGVVLTITNPNVGPVRVGSIALDTAQGSSGFAVDGAHSACGLGALSYATQTNDGSGWTLAGGGSVPITLANALSMTSSAANACQGATFTVYLTAVP